MLTIQECSQISKLHPASIRRAIKRGDLKGIRRGKMWFVHKRELAKWLGNPAYHKTGMKTSK